MNSAPETTPADVAGAGQTPAKATRAAKPAAGTAASAAPKKAPAVKKTATKAAKPGAPSARAPRRAPRPSGAGLAVPPPASLRVMVVASECSPLVNSGDLGDAVATLVDGLTAAGHDVTCVVPRFSGVLAEARAGELRTIAMGDRSETVTLFRAELRPGVRVVAIDHAGFFARPYLYGAGGDDYPDNPRRFAILAMVACLLADEAATPFDVIHAFDWQAGLVPVLAMARREHAPRAASAALVFTVHAPVFQGRCGSQWLPAFGLDERYASVDALEYWGGISLLKGGINFADVVTVADPAVVTTPPGGWGFEGILAARGEALSALDLGQVPALAGAAATALYQRARAAAQARR
ncbi:MAG: glycogen/starch synthase [Acidobacteria bacterium]|nr:glycogen/starch synthase [Acidobacteriota bacterium]